MRTRQKASDVFAESNYIFSQKVSFQEAFPELQDARVEVEEDGEGTSHWNNKLVYSAKSGLGEYIDCHNPLCYKGGVNIGSIVRSMVTQKQTEFETSVLCKGYEGSPKGRRKYRDCINFFKIKVTLTYKVTGI